ncbi:hypothetical protein ACHAXN_003711 [Cyclotella atomus]
MDYSSLVSQIRVMHQQEKSISYRSIDYMSMAANIVRLCPSDREALCIWGYRTVAACNGVCRSTAVKAISYFDRFLGTSAPAAMRARTDLGDAQLAFIACLVISLKVHSCFNVKADFVSNVVCRNEYDANEICAMELYVLQALGWKLNGPLGHDFIDYYLEAVPSIQGIHREFLTQLSKGLVELAMTKYSMALHRPSEVAFASIFCALQYAEFDVTVSLLAIQMISGLDQNDPKLRKLFHFMSCLVSEFVSEPESNGARRPQVQLANSVSDEDSLSLARW